ncbi:MAG: aminomethyl-transferring glycine dehydrogenase subunit GcvPA [Paludibacteraceae bacterium]|nr:aminomethyl-transferring glycine dehydrogenase subunit GcvPA [Paludibacteraceae bacterium]
MNYTPHTKQDETAMLAALGLKSVQELMDAQIPEELRLKGGLPLPEGKSEMEVERQMRGIAAQNVKFDHIYRGAGAYYHYIPATVRHVATNTSLISAYTPYQPEISQGILQATFEYQTMMCMLTGLDASNASVYDGATAAAEACKLALDKKRRQILVSEAIKPENKKVIETYLYQMNVDLQYIPVKEGKTDIEALKGMLSEQTAGVYVEQLNYYGIIEDMKAVGDLTAPLKALFIAGINPIAAAILPSAAECGADIAVGEAQPLGLSLSFGGPYLGFMTAKMEHIRKLPGRIIGETVDKNGKRCFVLTLQAREQHIKREKASSSICSNQANCAILASVYLATVGGEGLKQIATQCCSKAHYLASKLSKLSGWSIKYGADFFMEFVTESQNPKGLLEFLQTKGILGGLQLSDNEILWCVTEMASKDDLDTLVSLIEEYGKGGSK